MVKNVPIIFIVSIFLLMAAAAHRKKLIEERERYQNNIEVLTGKIQAYKIDSARNCVESSSMRLTIDEFKRIRENDMKKIKELKIDIKRLQASLDHQMSTNIPVNVRLRDTVIVRDTLLTVPRIKLENKHLDIDAIIVDDTLQGNISLDVNLKQYIYTIPKHKFLWFKWGVKGIKQVIMSDNPYVKINYSNYIRIDDNI